MSVDYAEVGRLTLDLRTRARQAPQLVSRAIRKTALDIETDAKILAPVDTGNLRNSISTDISVEGDATEAVVGPTAEYGIFQELGTSVMAAQPFLGPAFDRRMPALQSALSQIGVL